MRKRSCEEMVMCGNGHVRKCHGNGHVRKRSCEETVM